MAAAVAAAATTTTAAAAAKLRKSAPKGALKLFAAILKLFTSLPFTTVIARSEATRQSSGRMCRNKDVLYDPLYDEKLCNMALYRWANNLRLHKVVAFFQEIAPRGHFFAPLRAPRRFAARNDSEGWKIFHKRQGGELRRHFFAPCNESEGVEGFLLRPEVYWAGFWQDFLEISLGKS